MFPLLRIAFAEFCKAFARKPGTPAARDFAWLTMFFALTAFLAFLGLSAHQGMWDRFEQVLLGALPGGGAPIRVTAHSERPEGFSAAVIDDFNRAFPALTLVPMRRFDGAIGTVAMPGMALESETNAANKPAAAGEDSQPPAADSGDKPPVAADNVPPAWGRNADAGWVGFVGFAMPLDAPVWRWVQTLERRQGRELDLNQPFPTFVVASRSLFAKHFSYQEYRSAVVKDHRIPCSLRTALPDKLHDDNDPTELKSLILQVTEGYRDSRIAFHRFDVIWVDSFPMLEPVAMILPLSTIEASQAAEERPGLDINTESHGAPVRRILSLRLSTSDPKVREEFRKVAACLGADSAAANQQSAQGAQSEHTVCGAPVQTGRAIAPQIPTFGEEPFEQLISAAPGWPLRIAQVASCLKGTSFSQALSSPAGGNELQLEYTDPSPRISWLGPLKVEVPCSAFLPSDRANAAAANPCRTSDSAESSGTVLISDAYRYAMIYKRPSQTDGWGLLTRAMRRLGLAPDADAASDPPTPVSADSPASLEDLVQTILDWTVDGRHVFRLDPAYESALVRFGVLSTLIDRISLPLAIGLTALYLALSWVILATTFLHRRAQYGLLAMNGVTSKQLEFVVSFQICFGCLIGCLIGYAAFICAVWLVNVGLSGSLVIAKARSLIGLDMPSFLEGLSRFDTITIWLAMTVSSCLVANLLLRIQGISVARAPIDLIKA